MVYYKNGQAAREQFGQLGKRRLNGWLDRWQDSWLGGRVVKIAERMIGFAARYMVRWLAWKQDDCS